ncbi:MAG: chemotaxis protein CheW [Deltaproteobacteria bacterium]|jgi:purine-binding chemotaxis protein CheW|nr:chemotaxis protein CheW [Deltaproteobacteria bacterium]
MANPTTDQSSTQYLSFFLGGEAYAIGILRVREILEYQPPTRVPQTPPSIRGVINLRGKVIPIVDLAVKFGLPATEATKWTCIIVVETNIAGETAVMGVLADSVSEVIDLPPSDIEAPPSFGTRVKVDYLRGMGRVGQKFMLLLDIDRVLSADETAVAGSVPAASVPKAVAPEAPQTPK